MIATRYKRLPYALATTMLTLGTLAAWPFMSAPAVADQPAAVKPALSVTVAVP